MMCAASLSSAGVTVTNGYSAPRAVLTDGDRSRSFTAPAFPRVAIFVYHRFVAETDDDLAVSVATFETQVAWLREHAFAVVPLRDIVAWRRDPNASIPPRAVALTVDDGHPSVGDVLAPIVLRERLPVTLFVHPPAVAATSQVLGWDDLRALHRTTLFDVQPYMWWYPELAASERLRAPDAFHAFIRNQFDGARTQLRQRLGCDADLLAWAPGLCDDELIALARQAGYSAGFTLDPRRVTRDAETLALPRFPMIERCKPTMLGRLLGARPDLAADR